MVKYYGRARQRTGSINTKQVGLKMSGCPSKIGRQGYVNHYIGSRVNCMNGLYGGSLVNGVLWNHNKMRNKLPFAKMPTEKCVAAAGGIGNINTPYYKTVQPGKKGCGIMHQREGGGKIGTHGKLPDNEWHEWVPGGTAGQNIHYVGFAVAYFPPTTQPPFLPGIGNPDIPNQLGSLPSPHDYDLNADITLLYIDYGELCVSPPIDTTFQFLIQFKFESGAELYKGRPQLANRRRRRRRSSHRLRPLFSHPDRDGVRLL